MKWWGKEVGSLGWSCLLYEWLYVPICNFFNAEPWSLTKYGLIAVGTAAALNLIQYSLGMQPSEAGH